MSGEVRSNYQTFVLSLRKAIAEFRSEPRANGYLDLELQEFSVKSSNGSGGTPIDVGGGGDSPLGGGGHSPFGIDGGLGGPYILLRNPIFKPGFVRVINNEDFHFLKSSKELPEAMSNDNESFPLILLQNPIFKPVFGNSNYNKELLGLDGIAKGGSVGAGESGGPPGNRFDFLGFPSNGGFAGGGLVNGMYDGSGMANGFAGAGGLGGSPVENSNGSGGAPIDVGGGDSPSGGSGGDPAYNGHYPFGGGGGDSPLGGGGHSPFGSSGLGGRGVDDAESYPSV